MNETIISLAKEKMNKTIESYEQRLRTVRAGRANPSSLDGIVVSYYGSMTPLKQLATISVPEATQLLIKPFDKGCLKDIEKAIVVVDSLNLETNKTKDMLNILNNLKLANKKVLIVVDELNENLILATRNIASVMLLEASEINTLDVVSADALLMTTEAAKKVGEVLI